MMDLSEARGILDTYLQSDAQRRASIFKDFHKALAAMGAAEGPDLARRCAARAVTPALDYSSLRSLRRHLAGTRTDGLRMAVLGGPTTHQLVELLELFLAGSELPARVFQCEYGLFRQEILSERSSVDRFAPQVVFLATSERDVVCRPHVTAGKGDVGAALEAEMLHWQHLWKTAHERWGAVILQNTFEIPPWDVFGHFGVRHAASSTAYLRRLNDAFAEQAPSFVTLHDLNRLVLERGAAEWFDPRFYFEAKMPCGPESLVTYAHSVTSLVRAFAGKSKKALVLDLDNTIWGGTVGDVGAGGIQLGHGSSVGEAHLTFQRYAKTLHDRGILLCVCSKNDEWRAKEPFEKHPDMVLRLSDIACFVANWRNKADNLRDIAARLSIGLDSLVFVDDHPAERALVRRLAPEVAVPDMPEDPAGYIHALASQRYFETVSFTNEDANRTGYYLQNARREELIAGSQDLEGFLASLEMVATVEPVSSLNIDRVTQLINKSNQFNLTTRRYTLAEVQAIAGDPLWRTLTIRLADKLGDNGLISVVFLRKAAARMEVDTWLMSCRVLQRGVEHLALKLVVQQAHDAGCECIVGSYVPTERNSIVSDHYARLGFVPAGMDGNATLWELPLSRYQPTHTHISMG